MEWEEIMLLLFYCVVSFAFVSFPFTPFNILKEIYAKKDPY